MAKKVTRSDEKKSIFGLDVNGPVFFTSAFIIILSVALTLIYKSKAETYFNEIQSFISSNMGWLFILSVNVSLSLSLSPYSPFPCLGAPMPRSPPCRSGKTKY